jgi:hypothetical protein
LWWYGTTQHIQHDQINEEKYVYYSHFFRTGFGAGLAAVAVVLLLLGSETMMAYTLSSLLQQEQQRKQHRNRVRMRTGALVGASQRSRASERVSMLPVSLPAWTKGRRRRVSLAEQV